MKQKLYLVAVSEGGGEGEATASLEPFLDDEGPLDSQQIAIIELGERTLDDQLEKRVFELRDAKERAFSKYLKEIGKHPGYSNFYESDIYMIYVKTYVDFRTQHLRCIDNLRSQLLELAQGEGGSFVAELLGVLGFDPTGKVIDPTA